MRQRTTLILAVAASLLLGTGAAHAADPTTADCLAASDASLRSGNQHKLRAERAELLTCASANCPTDIRKECIRRVNEINAQIPTIIFEAKDPAGNDLSMVKVTVDGDVLVERLEGSALSIDPGEHVFTFETAGQPTVTKKFVIREAEKERREAVQFGTPIVKAPPPMQSAGAAEPKPKPNDGLGTQKVVALGVAGVGVIGLGVGAALGILAISKKSDAQSVCPESQCATADGVNKWSQAGSTGNISTIGFIVGGVAIAGAAVLWFTAPSAGSGGSTQVGIGPTGLQLKGTW